MELEKLQSFFDGEEPVLVAYLFGSHARGEADILSDVDVAVFLSKIPPSLLDFHLRLIDNLSRILGKDVDVVVLNLVGSLLKYQVVRYGKPVYSRRERERVQFEARTMNEYLDFSRVLEEYDRCLMEEISRSMKG